MSKPRQHVSDEPQISYDLQQQLADAWATFFLLNPEAYFQQLPCSFADPLSRVKLVGSGIEAAKALLQALKASGHQFQHHLRLQQCAGQRGSQQ